MAPPAASAITMALATPSSSIDFRSGAFDATKMGPAGLTAAAKHPHGLPPTPPNSYSPNLPARAVRAGFSSPPPVSLERELDLQDAVDHAKAQDQPNLAPVPLSKEALSGLEREHIITPAMIARDYLPNIMVGHGDMAIRHIIACLNHDVSGFSKIEPSRARRTVVAALENRAGGGPDGNIQFVKVGWGRWLAHVKGQKPTARPIATSSKANRLSPAASDSSFTASYSGTSYPAGKRFGSANRSMMLGHSYTGSDMPSLDEGLEDMSMSDNEIDNMSIDGGESDDSSSDGAGDETDEEDWAAIGAAALRRRASKPTIATGGIRRNYNLLCIPGPVNTRRLSSTSSSAARASASRIASSAPVDRFRSGQYISTKTFNHNNSADAMDIDFENQEREAARALLSLGSM
ncbi:hypothetical protein K461DRAFT_164524 [Myriangium duriaei CBS 260.36]|uniref:Sin3 binding protein-domain-containing protein n=1 Tax=Myriangium duriaei CBS 260.36 TaxID=1168546 RepID=A0A9P4IY06_9PEZI|nr:hypothetical protein K461DRAFT_164524 [Myriangium duriaei CBS 260.36]